MQGYDIVRRLITYDLRLVTKWRAPLPTSPERTAQSRGGLTSGRVVDVAACLLWVPYALNNDAVIIFEMETPSKTRYSTSPVARFFAKHTQRAT